VDWHCKACPCSVEFCFNGTYETYVLIIFLNDYKSWKHYWAYLIIRHCSCVSDIDSCVFLGLAVRRHRDASSIQWLSIGNFPSQGSNRWSRFFRPSRKWDRTHSDRSFGSHGTGSQLDNASWEPRTHVDCNKVDWLVPRKEKKLYKNNKDIKNKTFFAFNFSLG